MTDLGDWFQSVPFFTRYWLALTAGISILGRFGLVNPYYLILLYEPLKQFQVKFEYICLKKLYLTMLLLDMETNNGGILLSIIARDWFSFFN